MQCFWYGSVNQGFLKGWRLENLIFKGRGSSNPFKIKGFTYNKLFKFNFRVSNLFFLSEILAKPNR
jgi:hypothetical protein